MLGTAVYRDDLPHDCPPSGAELPDGGDYYRFVEIDVALGHAFNSWKVDNPDGGIGDPCREMSVSLYRPLERAERRLAQLRERESRQGPNRSDKWRKSVIYRITLPPDAGAIMGGKTRRARRAGHYDWWPARDFDIAEHTTRM